MQDDIIHVAWTKLTYLADMCSMAPRNGSDKGRYSAFKPLATILFIEYFFCVSREPSMEIESRIVESKMFRIHSGNPVDYKMYLYVPLPSDSIV